MEILNENDNSPAFAEDNVLSLIISEVRFSKTCTQICVCIHCRYKILFLM